MRERWWQQKEIHYREMESCWLAAGHMIFMIHYIIIHIIYTCFIYAITLLLLHWYYTHIAATLTYTHCLILLCYVYIRHTHIRHTAHVTPLPHTHACHHPDCHFHCLSKMVYFPSPPSFSFSFLPFLSFLLPFPSINVTNRRIIMNNGLHRNTNTGYGIVGNGNTQLSYIIYIW